MMRYNKNGVRKNLSCQIISDTINALKASLPITILTLFYKYYTKPDNISMIETKAVINTIRIDLY